MEGLCCWFGLINELQVGEVGDSQVVLVLDKRRRSGFVGARKEIVKVIKCLSEGINFFLLAFNKNLQSQHLVSGVVFGDERHSIGSIGLGSSCEVPSFNCELDIGIQVFVEQFWSLLLSLIKTVLPVVGFLEDVTGSIIIAHL